MKKFLVVRDSSNNGTVANLGSTGSVAVTVFKTSGGADESSNATATIVDSAHGLICVTYDPLTNGDAGGYLTVTPGGAGASPAVLISGDATPAISFTLEQVNASQINGITPTMGASLTFPTSVGTSTLTQTQVTGGAYSIQNVSCVLGDARIANLDATVSSRGTSTLTQTQVTGGAYSVQSASCVLGDARVANLDAAVSSRMATYTQPTGFLAATFPSGTVANTTNITAGTITTTTNLTNAPTAGDFTATMKTSLNAATPTVSLAASQHVIVDSGTVTTLTNLPSIPANWLTATGIAASALNGKGDWNTTTPPTTAAITTAILTTANTIEGAYTVTQTLQWLLSRAASGKLTGAQTTDTKLYAPDGTTLRIEFTVDSSGNISAVALT